jgi:N-acetylneuraminic acid mutarotase
MAAPGQTPGAKINLWTILMVTTVITIGKQNKVVGKMSASRVGLCAGATIKENNTIYIIKGQKSNPALCTRRYPGRVAEVFYK